LRDLSDLNATDDDRESTYDDRMGLSSSKSARVFKPAKAKGGCELDTSKTALVLIEYQF
jgi:hypothetical protein